MLVAISIPIFTNQLEKSREAVDEANIRNAYAVISAAALDGDTGIATQNTDKISYAHTAASGSGDTAKPASYTATVKSTQHTSGWTGTDAGYVEIGGMKVVGTQVDGATWVLTADANGQVTISTAYSATTP